MGAHDIHHQYGIHSRKRLVYFVVISILFLFSFIAGFATGPGATTFETLFGALMGRGTEVENRILFTIRLPRLLAATLGGLALAVSGAVMQSVLRNPLGSPFTLGISNAATFGASLAIVFPGLLSFLPAGWMHQLGVSVSAFAWALIGCFFILFMARQRSASPVNIVLAGIIASTLFSALSSGLQFFADDTRLASIVYWTFGDLSKGHWQDLILQTIIVLPVTAYFILSSRHYNALNQGDDIAHSLGINVRRFRLVSMVLASLATAAIVSVYGMIAFVGLVIPHIVRRIIGGNESYLIPATAITGATFLLLCDIIARTVISPVTLPVGIVTSVIGAPVFIFLMLKTNSFQWRS